MARDNQDLYGNVVDDQEVDSGNVTFNTGDMSNTTGIGGNGGAQQATQQPNKNKFKFNAPGGNYWNYGWDMGAHQGQEFDYRNPAEGAKYAFANIIGEMGVDPNSADANAIAAELNKRYGSSVFRADSNKRVSYGDEFIDWSGEGKPQGQFFWGSTGGGTPGVAGGGGVGGGGTGTGHGGGAGGSGFGLGGGYNDTIHQEIMNLLKKGNTPVTREDIAAQYDPVARQYQRAGQRQKMAAAERMAAQGMNAGGAGGALDAEQAKIDESTGESESALMSQLMGSEIQARRQDVMNALAVAQGEDRLALQKYLAELDNQIKQQGLTLQGQSLGLQQQQINNQNQQFYDQFGYNAGLQEYLLSQLLGQSLGQ